MTVTELYDQLSDEELKDIMVNYLTHREYLANVKINNIAASNGFSKLFDAEFFIYKQAATRWLKNQKP